jgi:hypothetical protein
MKISGDKAHILVTGPHRSGTTWVGKTIAFHDSVHYVHEPFNVSHPNPDAGITLNKWFTHAPTSPQRDEIDKAFRSLFSPNLADISRRFFASLRKDDFSSSMLSAKKALGLYHRKPIVLLKDPIAIFSAGWLHRTYGLRVVCMTRNPLGFVGSLKKAGWNFDFPDLLEQKTFLETRLSDYCPAIERFAERPGDLIDHGCLLWNLFHSTILRYRNEYPGWHFSKHEDLANDPVRQFRKMFGYLGLQMDEDIEARIEEYTSSGNRAGTDTTAFGPRDAKGSVTRWKHRLTPGEVARVLEATAPVAKHFYPDVEMVQ